MNPTTSSERLTKAMAYARKHWKTQRTHEIVNAFGGIGPEAFTVAISRESGTNGSSIARTVGTHLNWPVYDKELIQKIAEQMGLRAELLESVDEKQRSWLQESCEAFLSTPSVSSSSFVRHLLETILALGVHGDCIIVGRGAAQILPAETTLRVRIVAPLQDRIANKARTLGISLKEAAQQVETTDRDRNWFLKSNFQKDPTDPMFYDLVLNSARFSINECADLIVEAMHRLQTHTLEKMPEFAK